MTTQHPRAAIESFLMERGWTEDPDNVWDWLSPLRNGTLTLREHEVRIEHTHPHWRANCTYGAPEEIWQLAITLAEK